ncbi:mixed lineage kinase domain-like protein [Larimichthys crocea]|uniref:mixed lineage kinase domain-like protein n=1 Tax=Larimichthys crocea TaxID=215358 RepID=UPI000901595A|nr:mixed lineage kinase domain-like protein [Larimichthys crocea]
MDYIEPILSIASEIYTLVEKVKANRERCQRLSCRVKALEKVIKETGKRQPSGEVEQALRELHITLESAKNFIEKFTSANLMKRIVNSGSHEGEFDIFNERLSDAVQVLSVFLQVEQQNVLDQVFDQTTRQKEDAVDGRKDNEELKKLLHDYMKAQEEKYEQLRIDVEKRMASLNKPSITEITTRMIKSDELKYDHPKKPFMTTPSSEVYRGEYNGFPVAIKRYTDLLNTSLRDVKSIFNKEVETMKRFESPNILRMFGISVKDEEGPSPQFLIIMEYCEKGSLRQVLDSDCKLSWTRKACMCLDAAKGLYRLHQTEEKSKVHGCINSSKFLVDKGYTVKLGGFELSKTETSLKKSIKTSTHREEGHCYYTPQKLNNINHKYSKECEIYSFGIVLWEIATRKKPFDGLTIQDVYQKVYTEKYQEPLPDDCPEPLGSLINDCRAYDSFQRPNAGVLVDKLGIVVAQLEE